MGNKDYPFAHDEEGWETKYDNVFVDVTKNGNVPAGTYKSVRNFGLFTPKGIVYNQEIFFQDSEPYCMITGSKGHIFNSKLYEYGNPFYGKTFCCVGKMEKFPNDCMDFADAVRVRGGNYLYAGAMTAIDFVVYGELQSTEELEMLKEDCKISGCIAISEHQFMLMLVHGYYDKNEAIKSWKKYGYASGDGDAAYKSDNGKWVKIDPLTGKIETVQEGPVSYWNKTQSGAIVAAEPKQSPENGVPTKSEPVISITQVQELAKNLNESVVKGMSAEQIANALKSLAKIMGNGWEGDMKSLFEPTKPPVPQINSYPYKSFSGAKGMWNEELLVSQPKAEPEPEQSEPVKLVEYGGRVFALDEEF